VTRRPWTDEDQAKAEVAAACGVSFSAIGRMLGRSDTMVQRYLVPGTIGARREYSRRYYEQNAGRHRDYARSYRERNPETVHERVIQWRRKNPEAGRQYSRIYRAQNPEVVREQTKRWREQNREVHREQRRRRGALKRAARRCSLHPLTLATKIERFALWGDRCAYCGAAGTLTVDHVLALISGGMDEPDNIAPACGRCNSSKRQELAEQWFRRQPFFTTARWRKLRRHCPAATAGQPSLAIPAAQAP
jgi:5-methylcytosine-specific restriction endonuclease McrA